MSILPNFDFNDLPLCKASRNQLSNIYRPVFLKQSISQSRAKLLHIIRATAFDEPHGFYVPLSPNIYLKGQLPEYSKRCGQISFFHQEAISYFTNALLIPAGYRDLNFLRDEAAPPTRRVTNAGFLVVTIEFDPDLKLLPEAEARDEFEESLEWTRGKGGDFKLSKFADLDRELKSIREYRGHNITFAGNKSLHFHFIFDTSHLETCPSGAAASERTEKSDLVAATISAAYQMYWDRAAEAFQKILCPKRQADKQLRKLTQWRRLPWGLRNLDKPSTILGLEAETIVPQVVIHEEIRSRSSSGAKGYLVSPTFLVNAAPPPRKSSSANRSHVSADTPMMLEEFQKACFDKWGEYPRPVAITDQKGEWRFNFQNNAHDQNPSTYVLGDHNRLVLCGNHELGDREFLLPDDMTAQDWGDYISSLWGSDKPKGEEAINAFDSGLTSFQRLKVRSATPVLEWVRQRLERQFPEPISASSKQLKRQYGEKLAQTLLEADAYFSGCPLIIKSVEGIGKTAGYSQLHADAALDRAMNPSTGSSNRFSAFAFRSREQAQKKADEFSTNGISALAITPFWYQLSSACAELGVAEIKRDEFDGNLIEILEEIQHDSPAVYELMRERHSQLWCDHAFDGVPLILMTHDLAALWYMSNTTRAWYNPELFSSEEVNPHHLREKFALTTMVFDDPEASWFLHILPAEVFNFFYNQQTIHYGWRYLNRLERREIFQSLWNSGEIPKLIKTKDDFNAFMRLDLKRLKPFQVDYDKFPFGRDNNETGLYHRYNGQTYYVGPKQWVVDSKITPIFLTTEKLVTDVIEKAFGKHSVRFNFDHLPGIFPIHIPRVLDKRARKEKISSLSDEILEKDVDSIVIADGIRNRSDRELSFQKMKGLNGLEDKNIYVIPTWLSSEQYRDLNLLGQWLGSDTVLIDHYEDQINQAIGRNRGFRQGDNEAKCVVVCSPSFWRNFLYKCKSSRATFYDKDSLFN